MSGNPIAGFSSDILRPEAALISRKQPWDQIWFMVQEAIAFPCWYLIGLWIDTGHFRFGIVMFAYLILRFILAITRSYEIGWRIQVLFWLGLLLWLSVLGLSRLIRVGIRSATRT